MAFMPFVTAGDPDMPTTVEVIKELARRGVDLIEVGFPYSDPIADGPVIQSSYTRALGHGLHVSEIFAGIASLERDNATLRIPPLVAMVAYAIVFRMGVDRFIEQAQRSGFAGLIVPDLPGDEAGEFASACRHRGIDLAQLISPTTPPERAERILKTASGFVYCVSVAGTTGVRDQLPPELYEQLRWLRSKTELPLAVGFGVSRPEQVQPLKKLADGVIVGSAIVRRFEQLKSDGSNAKEIFREIGEYSASFVNAAQAHG